MTGAETRGYILKFRCVDCGKHEVSADYPCEGVMHMDQIKARIYEAHCKSSKQTARILSLGGGPLPVSFRDNVVLHQSAL